MHATGYEGTNGVSAGHSRDRVLVNGVQLGDVTLRRLAVKVQRLEMTQRPAVGSNKQTVQCTNEHTRSIMFKYITQGTNTIVKRN